MWVALGISAAEAASLVVAARRWLSFVDRRTSSERRSSADRRLQEADGVVGRVLRGSERRSGNDRRSGTDRRQRQAPRSRTASIDVQTRRTR